MDKCSSGAAAPSLGLCTSGLDRHSFMQPERIQRTYLRNILRTSEGWSMNHADVHPVDQATVRATPLFWLLSRITVDQGMEHRDHLWKSFVWTAVGKSSGLIMRWKSSLDSFSSALVPQPKPRAFMETSSSCHDQAVISSPCCVSSTPRGSR